MDVADVNTLFQTLYQDIDGWNISQKNFDKLDHVSASFLYDEASVDSFYTALTIAKPTSEDVFIDLGSGLGKKTLTAALLFPIESHGIEILEDMVALSQSVTEKVTQRYPDLAQKIHIIRGDYYDHDFSYATIVHISVTPEIIKFQMDATLGAKLRSLQKGTRIIISEVPILFPEFHCLNVIDYVFPTRVEKAYIYEKII